MEAIEEETTEELNISKVMLSQGSSAFGDSDGADLHAADDQAFVDADGPERGEIPMTEVMHAAQPFGSSDINSGDDGVVPFGMVGSSPDQTIQQQQQPHFDVKQGSKVDDAEELKKIGLESGDDGDDRNDDDVLDERLTKIRDAIDKATQEAMPAGMASIYKERSIHDDTNLSFRLGMDLFGQEPSVVERNIRESLAKVERNLERVLDEDEHAQAHSRSHDRENISPLQTSSSFSASMGVDSYDDPAVDGFPAATTGAPADAAISTDQLREKAQHLSQRIAFLRACSLARSKLDDSKTLSTPALARNASHLTVDGEVNLPEAAISWLKAYEHLCDANQKMDDMVEEQRHIFRSIQSDIRSQRVELVHAARNNLQSCITLEANEMSVKSSRALEDSYHVLETLQGHGGENSLSEFIRRLTQRLIKQVVHPLIAQHKQSKTPLSAVSYQIVESSDRASKSLLGGTAANILAKSKSATMHRMEWSRDLSSARRAPSSETFPAITAWQPTLELMGRIIAFVHKHVLMERPMLYDTVERRCFGKPDALPSPLRLEVLAIDSKSFGYDNGLWMDPLARAITETTLPDFVPSSDLDQLDTMGKLLKSFCRPFVDTLKQLSASSQSESNITHQANRLLSICEQYTSHYIDHRREILLFEARELIEKSDYHNTQVAGYDPSTHSQTQPPKGIKGTPFEVKIGNAMSVFLLHKASVSQIAQLLLDRIHATMEEAVSAAKALNAKRKADHINTQQAESEFPATTTLTQVPWDELPAVLYKTARQYLFLYRSIIPSKYDKEVSKIPRTAAILHNDCIFFSHHCLTLGLQYKDDLGPPKEDIQAGIDNSSKLVPQLCMFVDMVPLFRELADRSLGQMIDIQKQQIVDLVVPRIGYLSQSLSSSEPVQEWSDAETAVDAALYHLQHLQQTWNPPLLSLSIFGRSMGFLADVLMTIFSHHVVGTNRPGGAAEAMPMSITPRACHFLTGLFDKIRHGLIQTFERAGASEQTLSTSSNEWSRFTAWTKVWASSLSDIEVALSQGIFRDVLGPELAGLIRAMFVDSPRRQTLLKAILEN